MENNFPQRKRTRYKDHDYSSDGYYFITACIKDRKDLFGSVISLKMILNKYGLIVDECWKDLPNHYCNCQLDNYVIMPDHIHGILAISNSTNISKKYSVSEILRGFKTFSSKNINKIVSEAKSFQWQKSFYDRVIRNEKELFEIRKYIDQNPMKWEYDKSLRENIYM